MGEADHEDAVVIAGAMDISEAALSMVEGKRVPLVIYQDGKRVVIGEAVVQPTTGMGIIGTAEADQDLAHQVSQELELPYQLAFAFSLPPVLDELQLSPDD